MFISLHRRARYPTTPKLLVIHVPRCLDYPQSSWTPPFLWRIARSKLLSPHSGFGAIHAAVLALATKCVGSGRWLAAVQPQMDAEMFSTSEHGSHFLATILTVGDALDALNALCNDLAHTLKQIADLSAELAAREHISVENIGELLPDADPVFLRRLDIPQKCALVCRELARELCTSSHTLVAHITHW
ncbi:hypothetical protein B0H14DRAFT_3478861 [Mycena olivaceomarginata]|nr:hypothetical protein B0H14DRAFT_3478861 [Mycena olivaceomarginata]